MTTQATPPSDSGPAEPVSELIVRAERWFREQPDVIACQVGGRSPVAVTYGQLSRSVDRAVATLAGAGFRPSMRTGLLVPPGPELGTLVVALVRLRAVPVLIDPGLPLNAIRRCLRQAASEAFIGIPVAQLARKLLGWTPDVRVSVTVPSRRPRGSARPTDTGPSDAGLSDTDVGWPGSSDGGRSGSGLPDIGPPDVGLSDTGRQGGRSRDAERLGTGLSDSGLSDARPPGSGSSGAGWWPGSGSPDAGQPGSEPSDAGVSDTRRPDAGLSDMGRLGSSDGGRSGSGLPDIGPPDSGLPNTRPPGSGLSGTRSSGGFSRGRPPGDLGRWSPARADDLALIAYTSGSTGPPKGVPLRHRHLAAQLDLLGPLGTVTPGMPVLSTFAPFALGAAAFGATVVIPDMDPRHPVRVDPAALVTDIRRYRVAGMFAPPALLDRLARYCAAHGLVLDTLGDVVSAGAPLPMPVMDRLRGCLRDDARMLSVYGATECMPVAAIESRLLTEHAEATAAGAGTCLGPPLPGTEVRVITVGDGPIERWSDDLVVPPGTIGEIVVAAPTVADPYLDDPEATALARIRDGDRVWHRMGDLGRFDEQGRLWFAGRKSERVRTIAGDLYTDQVEPVFAAVPGVRRTALVGVGPAGAQRAVLVVECESESGDGDTRVRARLKARMKDWVGDWVKDRVKTEILDVAAHHPHTAALWEVLFHPGFPVDARHNSKIRRHELARWAARRVRGGRR